MQKAGSARVVLDLDDFRETLDLEVREMADYALQRAERIRSQQHSPRDIARAAEKVLGASHPLLRSFLGSPSVKTAVALHKELLAVGRKALDRDDFDTFDIIRKVSQDISEYQDSLSALPSTLEEAAAEYEDSRVYLQGGTEKNGAVLKGQVDAAIRRAPLWSTSLLRIRPNLPYRESISAPIDSFEVFLGQGDMAPSFTVFTNQGKVEQVEDKLEGGDTDFFRDLELQRDYFNLIAELESPGSTSRPGKDLVLWTARPTKDRDQYERSRSLPPNIFLTTDPNRAQGIARDLGGSEVRDLWRVVVNEMYLTKTLEAGRVRDYQVVSEKPVPAKRMELVEPGSTRRAFDEMARRIARRKMASQTFYGLLARPYLPGSTQPRGESVLVEFRDMWQKSAPRAKRLPGSRTSVFAIVAYPRPLPPEDVEYYSLQEIPGPLARKLAKDPWVDPYD